MKCINCGNYITKEDTFCTRCGNKINKKFWLRTLVLSVIAVIIPLICLNFIEGDISAVILFASYIVGAIIIEFALKANTRKEALFSNVYSVFLQVAIFFILVIVGVPTGDNQGVAILAIMLLELIYVPALLVINFLVNLVFGKRQVKIVNNNSN